MIRVRKPVPVFPEDVLGSSLPDHTDKSIALHGRRLGVLSNRWRSFECMVDAWEKEARDKFEASQVTRVVNPNVSSRTPQESMAKLALSSDAAIVGMGH